MRNIRAFCMVLAILFTVAMLPAMALAAPAAKKTNGNFIIEIADGATYRQLAVVSCDEFQKEFNVRLDRATNPRLRIRKAAEGLAFLDSVLLDGQAASGSKKLMKTDFDVQEITAKGVELQFTGSFDGNLSLTGRIEPKVIGGYPFMFPFGNTFIDDPQDLQDFFAYELGSNVRSVNVDGKYEDQGKPFDTGYLVPSTGHPAGYAYIYVSNDDDYLYASADFTSDNTFDYGDDFFKVFAKQGGTVKEFKQTSSGHEYGASAMQYTDKVEYEHMYYEVKIPIDQLGDTNKLQLAFSLYGTAAIVVPDETYYTVSYHPDGGSGTAPMDMNRYAPGNKVTLKPGTGLTKAGCTFKGWALADGTAVTDFYIMGKSDVTLFAVWEEGRQPKVPRTGDEVNPIGYGLVIAGVMGLAAVVFIQKAAKRSSAKR